MDTTNEVIYNWTRAATDENGGVLHIGQLHPVSGQVVVVEIVHIGGGQIGGVGRGGHGDRGQRAPQLHHPHGL